MTSSKSLFNFGIYKNTIKRFKWGSFLYFIILFFSLPFIILVQDKEFLLHSYRRVLETTPLILQEGFMVIPVLLAFLVPTIVTALCLNNVHSGKQGNFVHSLPVTRLENFISTLLSGLTLIVIPILLNAAILLIMSLTAYQEVITSTSVIYWFFVNITISFIMLSISVFSAYLTGHTAAHIVINILLHVTPLIIALGIDLICNIFLYGFSQSENYVAGTIVNNTPFVWLYSNSIFISNDTMSVFSKHQIWIYIAIALIFYFLSYLLYKNRKIESCGDVAAFRIFKPILKYAATVFSAILAFGIFSSSSLNASAIFTIAIALTAIVYFAAEMLIRKSVKVFSSYKGYVGFVLCAAVFISIFAYTDIFGYERRIPESDDIESASIYYRYGDNLPMVSDKKLIEDVRSLHSNFIIDIPVTEKITDNYTRLFVRYKLKNGKVLVREYNVSNETKEYALSKMYESTEYKNIIYSFDIINIDKVKNMDLTFSSSLFDYHFAANEDSKKLLEAIKKDLELLSYDEIESQEFAIDIRFYISQDTTENEDSGIFVTTVAKDGIYYPNRMYSFNMNINSNFKNTFEVLREQGYYAEFISKFCKGTIISTIPVYIKDGECTYKNDTGKTYEFMVSSSDMVPVIPQDAFKLAEKLLNEPMGEFGKLNSFSDGVFYMIFCYKDDYQVIDLNSHCVAFREENLPEYLIKYIK